MTFHPGKVVEIFKKEKNVKSIDNSIQVVLNMWDENVLVFDVPASLAKNMKEGDIALVDYRPVSDKKPVPRLKIIKVLKGEKGKKTWKALSDFLKKKKPMPATVQQPRLAKPPVQYIG